MKFDVFDAKMRKFEQSLDQTIPAGYFMVARLDGKGFTKLTKEDMDLEKPFDVRFRQSIINTINYLMTSYFQIAYAYNESDEISLLFKLNADKFNRKVRKYNSILAAETSVFFSKEIGRPAVFDCRMIPLPDVEDVQDYFAWRQADAERNAILAHCYYKLLSTGKTPQEAAAYLVKLPFRNKKALLATFGMDLNSIPKWQLYGSAVYWETTGKKGFNPIIKEPVIAGRARLVTEYDLPAGAKYRKMITKIISSLC